MIAKKSEKKLLKNFRKNNINKDKKNIICTLKLSPTNMRVEKINNNIARCSFLL